MSNYIIVDSNQPYAETLYKALSDAGMNENVIVSSEHEDLAILSSTLALRIKEKPESILLINAEGKIPSRYLQDQSLVELAFWLRCQHRLRNAIVYYSLQSINQLLQTKPGHFILLSPGCYHLQLPISKAQLKRIANLRPVDDIDSIRSFLKPSINLRQTRHRYANYVGMVLMMLLAQEVWKPNNEVWKHDNALYGELAQFLRSLDYHLLKTYFDLSLDVTAAEIARLKGHPARGTILLIDDLAAGWEPIISQMLYGKAEDHNIGSIKVHAKKDGDRKSFDYNKTKDELKDYIERNKPHLILLDLRLSDEEGEKELAELGGYRILRFIKQNSYYKGVPVIVFTASSNAEITKQLMAMGAESVWTKPGLDENLNTKQVIDRYEMLIRYVDCVFGRFDEGIRLESNQDVEDSRLKVLQRIEFLKYRARLSNLKSSNHYFNGFTDIFIDTNVVIDSVDSLCNVYKLAQICDIAKHTISVEGTDFEISAPKLVLLNFVVDEIIHWSKVVDPSKRYFWKLGLLAYDVVRGLFQDSLVRTEFNTFKENSNLPECSFTRTARDAFADPELIEDIHRIVSGASFKLRRRFRNGRSWATEERHAIYKTDNTKILLITNEAMNVAGKIPHDLTTKVNGLSNPLGTVKIINLATFAREVEAIPL